MATIFRDPLISQPQKVQRPPVITGPAGRVITPDAAKAFSQKDWPLPRSAVYPNQNRTYLHPAQTRLIGKDTFFGPAGFAPDYDWPLPRSAVYPNQNRTYLHPAQVRLIGQDTFFGPKGMAPDFDWPLPRTAPFPLSNRSGVQGRVLAPIKPFLQADWPLPESHQWDFRQGVVSGRALGPGAMPFGQDDWPLPVAKQQGKTWTWTQQLQVAAAPFAQDDWPLPAAKAYRAVEVGQNLLALYQIALPFNQDDWPLPRTTSFRPADAAQSLVSLLPTGVAPFTPQDWPLPRRSPFVLGVVSGRAIGFTVIGTPFTQLDWPTPRTTKQAPQDWPQNYLVGLAALGISPFTPQDWPLPRKGSFVLGVTSGRAIGTTAPAVTPFSQTDWPTPRWNKFQGQQEVSGLLPSTGVQPFSQNDWPIPRPLTKRAYFIQGQVSGRTIGVTVTATPFSQADWPLPGTIPSSIPYWYTVRYEIEPGPFGQTDWPLPQYAKYPLSLRTWLQTYNWSNLGQDQFAFSQDDWPLPKVTKFTQAIINGVTLILPAPPAPIAQYDWPLSRVAVYSTQTRTWTFVPIDIPPAIIVPPPPPEAVQPSTIGGIERWTIQIPQLTKKKKYVFKRNMENLDRQDLEDIAALVKAWLDEDKE